MISITDYRQFIAEAVSRASAECGVEADKIRLAVTESQLVNLLKDQPGVVVCGNVPASDLSHHTDGYWMSSGECLLMVLQKMPQDQAGTDREYDAMARLQQLMAALLTLLGDYYRTREFCDRFTVDATQPLRVEWEYNTYGGFNGLSVVFHLKDQKGTAL